MKMFCTNCGNPLDPGLKFCTNCGKAVPNPISETAATPRFEPVTTSPPPERKDVPAPFAAAPEPVVDTPRPDSRPHAPATEVHAKRRRSMMGVIVSGLILVALGAGAYVLYSLGYFKTNETTNTAATISKTAAPALMANGVLTGYYNGRVGEHKMRLMIDRVENDNVTGTAWVNNERRPVAGSVVKKRTGSTTGADWTIFELQLRESGNAAARGEYHLEFNVNKMGHNAKGTWRSLDRRVARQVTLAKK